MNFLELEQFLHSKGVTNLTLVMSQLAKYKTLLGVQNKVMNLTALPEDEYIEKHFYDSALLLNIFNFNVQTLLDIGSGAGFPGMILAICFPTLQVTLLEPTLKRCHFLTLVAETLNISNVEVINDRAENYIKAKREVFDIVTARAVANTRILSELAAPFLKVGGAFLLMKGKTYEDELKEATNALRILKLNVTNHEKAILPAEQSERYNAVLIKKGVTPQEYPRAYALIKKKPL